MIIDNIDDGRLDEIIAGSIVNFTCRKREVVI
jgi:hypothetical protein